MATGGSPSPTGRGWAARGPRREANQPQGQGGLRSPGGAWLRGRLRCGLGPGVSSAREQRPPDGGCATERTWSPPGRALFCPPAPSASRAASQLPLPVPAAPGGATPAVSSACWAPGHCAGGGRPAGARRPDRGEAACPRSGFWGAPASPAAPCPRAQVCSPGPGRARLQLGSPRGGEPRERAEVAESTAGASAGSACCLPAPLRRFAGFLKPRPHA